MTEPQQAPVLQVTGPAAANANVTSTGWTGAGISQGAPGWCYAASEQMIQRAFGVTITQAEIAHGIVFRRGDLGDGEGNAVTYHNGVLRIVVDNNLANSAWATVSQYVRNNQALYNLVRTEWGNPPLTGRTFTRTNAPDTTRIVNTINGGGLVMIGSGIHWKIVYGYASGPTGAVTSFKVYNPWDTGTDTPNMTPSAMSAGIEETYYVTA